MEQNNKGGTALGDLLFPLAIISVLAGIFLPLPAIVIDVLLAAQLMTAMVVVMTASRIERPIDFSSFPSLLMLLTIVRIGINVAAAKLILSNGSAGSVIHAIGSFGIGGNAVIGFVVFLLVFLVTFVVIINGMGRSAEVVARFNLDALPPRYMSIDSEVGQGKITPEEGQIRRDALRRESDFYAQMEGAAKFIKGEAMIGIAVVLVNTIGGFIVGVVQGGLGIGEALSRYAMLTVGDGLAALVPATMIAVSGGLLINRASGRERLGPTLFAQLAGSDARIFSAAGAFTIVLGMVPGMPNALFLTLGGAAVAFGLYLQRRSVEGERARARARQQEQVAAPTAPTTVLDTDLFFDDLAIDMGLPLMGWLYGLVAESKAKVARGEDESAMTPLLYAKVKLAEGLGLLVGDIRVVDNPALSGNEYVITVRGTEVGRGTLHKDRVFAYNPNDEELDPTLAALMRRDGQAAIEMAEPTSGRRGYWISPKYRDHMMQLGIVPIEPMEILRTHLTAACEDHAALLVSRRMVHELIDRLRSRDPKLVEDLTTGASAVPVSIIQKVLQALVEENVPIKDMATICETLIDHHRSTANLDQLIMLCRQALAGTITRRFGDREGKLTGIMLGPKYNLALREALKINEDRQRTIDLESDPETFGQMVADIVATYTAKKDRVTGRLVLLMDDPVLRLALGRLLRMAAPIPVLALSEILPHAGFELIATVDRAETPAPAAAGKVGK